MLRAYAMYRPFSVFFTLGLVLFFAGLLPVIRFLYFFSVGDGDGHIQSMVLGVALLILGALSWCLGILADLISANRQLLEMTLEKVRRLELENTDGIAATHADVASSQNPRPSLIPPIEFAPDFSVGPTSDHSQDVE